MVADPNPDPTLTLTLTLNGNLLIRPTAAALNLTIALPLSPTFITTSLTPLVPWTQLLANIVGLSGVLTVVGVLFGVAEKRLEVKKGAPVSGASGGGGGLEERMAHLSALVGEANQKMAEVAALERSLALAMQAQSKDAPLERGALVQANPLHPAAARPEAADFEVWVRHTDGADVWFVGPAGQLEWTAPSGVKVVDTADTAI